MYAARQSRGRIPLCAKGAARCCRGPRIKKDAQPRAIYHQSPSASSSAGKPGTARIASFLADRFRYDRLPLAPACRAEAGTRSDFHWPRRGHCGVLLLLTRGFHTHTEARPSDRSSPGDTSWPASHLGRFRQIPTPRAPHPEKPEARHQCLFSRNPRTKAGATAIRPPASSSVEQLNCQAAAESQNRAFCCTQAQGQPRK